MPRRGVGELCSNCRYWDPQTSTKGVERDRSKADSGYCRRYAPQPIENGVLRRWSYTDSRDWCGEWENAGRE
jgi:hypothetical protein